MIKIDDMMTRHPQTLSPEHSVGDAQALMNKHDIRHIPIVDPSLHLIGLVSHRDILRAQESCLLNDSCEQSSVLSSPISKLMNTQIMTVEPGAGLRESAIYMQKHKVGCLPVVDNEQLIGIITDSDFVSIAINLLELQENEELELF
jgi:CBS domain-containing membrane protein